MFFFPNNTCDASLGNNTRANVLILLFYVGFSSYMNLLGNNTRSTRSKPSLFLLINGFFVKKWEKSNASFIPAFADWCFRTLN